MNPNFNQFFKIYLYLEGKGTCFNNHFRFIKSKRFIILASQIKIGFKFLLFFFNLLCKFF